MTLPLSGIAGLIGGGFLRPTLPAPSTAQAVLHLTRTRRGAQHRATLLLPLADRYAGSVSWPFCDGHAGIHGPGKARSRFE